MEKIKVFVDWCGKNYAAYIIDHRIHATSIVVTAKTHEELEQKIQEALQFHIEECIADGDQMPKWAAEGAYTLDVEPRMSALLHEVQSYITLAALSRATGIKHAQLSHYANAVSEPKPLQRQRIVAGIHKIGQACMAFA